MDLHEHKIVAEYYDLYVEKLTHNSNLDNKSCVKFHLDLAAKYGKSNILDIACGTGNITIPLLEKNYQVDSLDISKEMMNILKSKINYSDKIDKNMSHLHIGNMTNFKINKFFSLAIIPRSGFMHLITPDDQKKSLINISNHLLPNGILSLNTFDPDLDLIISNKKQSEKNYFKRTDFINKNNNKVELYNSVSFDIENQLIDNFWLFKEYKNNKLINEKELPLKMRYSFRQELIYLFELTGYEILKIYGNYKKDEPKYPSTLIWILRKT